MVYGLIQGISGLLQQGYPKAVVTVWGFLLWVQQEEGWLVAKGHTENGFLLS